MVSFSSQASHFLKTFPVVWEANKKLLCQHPDTASDPTLCGHFLTLVGSSTYWHWNLFKARFLTTKLQEGRAFKNAHRHMVLTAGAIDFSHWTIPCHGLRKGMRGLGEKSSWFFLRNYLLSVSLASFGAAGAPQMKRKIVREPFSFSCSFFWQFIDGVT